MKYIVCFLIVGLFSFGCNNKGGYDTKDGELTWLTIEQASEIGQASNDKKFLVDVYTDWCGWCKVMDKKTFTDPELIKYLNDNFHVVKFNAEQKEPVNYRGKTYEWMQSGRNGVNTLGIELLNGRLSYPTLVYLDTDLQPITVSAGYKTPELLLAELKNLK